MKRASPSGSRKRPVAAAQAIAEPRGRPGGRSARVRASVLESAFDVLMDKGLDAFTIAEVAERSEVHETTIYRRWGTRNALVREACLHRAGSSLQIADTGSLRSDLAALLASMVAMIASREGQALLALGSLQHPHVVAVRQAIWQRRLGMMRTILDKAVARGEFPRDADPVQFLETLIAPLYLRANVTAEPLEAWRSNEMIDRLLAAYPVSHK
jgi:AcrR family transcriptional regulator